jgi:dTDP-4-dehydrorhamnose reductase
MLSSPAPQRVFVTGGTGLLGRHLLRGAEQHGWEVIAPGSTALDIRDAAAVSDQVAAARPDSVVHLAYRGNDPAVIVDGSTNVARAAAHVGARLVHLSTDVVFGGRPEPYGEDDDLSPITDYGRWKAQAEQSVAAACPQAVLVRTSLIYATDGPCPLVDDVAAALAGRSTIRFFTDEVRCPVHAADLARAVAALAERPDIAGPLHIAGPEALSRADIAARVARWLRLDPQQVPRASLADSGLVRPGVVMLDSGRAETLGFRCRPMDEALAR